MKELGLDDLGVETVTLPSNEIVFRAIDGFIEQYGITISEAHISCGLKTRNILSAMISMVVNRILELPIPADEMVHKYNIIKQENNNLSQENAKLRNGISALYEELREY